MHSTPHSAAYMERKGINGLDTFVMSSALKLANPESYACSIVTSLYKYNRVQFRFRVVAAIACVPVY